MTADHPWKITLLYDSDCPLCMREVNFLQRKDQGRGLVRFVDVADDNYDPEANFGITFFEAMERIHAYLPDGTILKNVAVFRRVYEILGMGWVYGLTKIPVIGKAVDFAYGIWAKYRLKVTGRPDLVTLIQEREARQTCAVDAECAI
ncbi:thiol-disulfide oxidoreductase DCC family protein [[Limnothrix rosea] IAM M-220]|uniref:thiol-disulfide oxidoreductase DCC family protein n=1 Tax=[Limnothrix rosea] IAM M-220 TaxID=454133 RepID=UPI00096108CC|nr:DUF393 domain-containing protein [[Limnothrix rosea] IAM M-220]OKH17042.1 thiol-disulfide oxidoreductase [[Limnothrix rosea] IAM M-220]